MNSSQLSRNDQTHNCPLKTVALAQIEEAISAALGVLMDETYSVKIDRLEFEPPVPSHRARLSLTIEARVSD